MRFSRFIDSLSIKASILAVLALSGCIATTLPYMRNETAQRIASPAWMIQRDIPANALKLRAYERIHDRGGVANLYIEGEGGAFSAPALWTLNPTPENPVALHMATKDKAENLIYLARPCQYVGTDDCDEQNWKSARFSEDVLTSYNAALDEIARRYDIKGFNLIGYSGGGAIATLLSAKRDDILSLRTVSAILDHKTLSSSTNSTSASYDFSKSLNPADYAEDLIGVPQYHFIGGQDAHIPPAVLHSYLQSMPPSTCVQTMLIQEAGYDEGWVNKWPELVSLPINCYQSDAPVIEPVSPTPPLTMPTKTLRETPVKP
ncbi:MAG: alpha/beta fold hydrolase [Alphaproteobacteria bacterium]